MRTITEKKSMTGKSARGFVLSLIVYYWFEFANFGVRRTWNLIFSVSSDVKRGSCPRSVPDSADRVRQRRLTDEIGGAGGGVDWCPRRGPDAYSLTGN